MSYVTTLKCRECGQEYPIKPLHVCETCFGPLEVNLRLREDSRGGVARDDRGAPA